MPDVARNLTQPSPIRQVPDPVDPSQGVLNRLRLLALECRAAPRSELFEACAVISARGAHDANTHARALVRVLGQALGRRPQFHRPGAAEVSFDEAWLTRAILARRSGDWESFEFLIRSRVPFSYQRNMAFLIGGFE